MSWIFALWQRLLFYALLLLIALISLTWNAIALCLHPLFDEARGRRIGRAGIAYGLSLIHI